MANATEDLADLRREIDRIDQAMHELLMERGRIIDRLIAAKRSDVSGSAFRPEREAAMMRALGARHRGRLPLDAVEGIWRAIISTFTHVQAPFAVHADSSVGAATMQDTARFHFGFTVPYVPEPDAGAVIRAVAESRGDLGLIALEAVAGAWWRELEPEGAPKVIARLPFTTRPDHPAPLPVLVVSKTISGEGLGAVVLYSVAGLAETAGTALGRGGGQEIARSGEASLIALPKGAPADSIAGTRPPVLVGSYPAVSGGG